MNRAFAIAGSLMLAASFLFVPGSPARAQARAQPESTFEPTVGQPGKDVVWVPTPFALVEKMLDMAKVTPQDFVMDLGSGDGRNIIAAAKRGARAVGVEYDPKMVELSRRTAQKEGVADKASFVRGDMFEADISQATVLALFLLPDNLRRLEPKFAALRPGTRIVVNAFKIDGWEPEEEGRAESDCGSWCMAYLYLVPARVEGTWRMPQGMLRLQQKAQVVSGSLIVNNKATPITNGRLRGDRITFTAGETTYAGRVRGDAISGEMQGYSAGHWSATRARNQ